MSLLFCRECCLTMTTVSETCYSFLCFDHLRVRNARLTNVSPIWSYGRNKRVANTGESRHGRVVTWTCTASILFFFFSGKLHQECLSPNVCISLQSGQFSATSIASFRERLLDFRSCWIVLIHIARGRSSIQKLLTDSQHWSSVVLGVVAWHQ